MGHRSDILVCALLVTAGTARAADPVELTVFAAASLREAFEDIGKAFEARAPGVKVRFSFAGSQELRAQIEHGARVDVFAAASLDHMTAIEKTGRARKHALFASNEPVLVVPRDNPARIASFADLPRASRLVIGTPEVPIGKYTLEILDRARPRLGDDFKDRVLKNVVSREVNVRQVLAKVSLGEADAAVVYRTDAMTARDRITAVTIPADLNVVASYPIAALTDAPQGKAAAAFVDFVLSGDGQKRLAAAGFTTPSVK